MTVLFDRAIEVTVGETFITDLRMQFRVLRNAKAQANTAELSIWNLNQETRAKLQQPKLPVLIQAGYADAIEQVFLGYMRKPATTREGPDIITTLQAGDGEVPMRRTRINESFAPGTSVTDVLKKLVNVLGGGGLSVKDALNKLKGVKLGGLVSEFVHGTSCTGNAWNELQGFLKRSGLEASVQDGQLQIVDLHKATEHEAVVLRGDCGLVGTPTINDKGILKARSLLQPSIWPARKLKVQANQVWTGRTDKKGNDTSYDIDGFYRCEQVIHHGDTHAMEWYSEVEARPL